MAASKAPLCACVDGGLAQWALPRDGIPWLLNSNSTLSLTKFYRFFVIFHIIIWVITMVDR